MIQTFTPHQERLEVWRAQTRKHREWLWSSWKRDERSWYDKIGRPLPVGGGAPTINTTLAVLHASVTKNNFTTAATIVGDDDRGPFSVDWFNTAGATFIQEGMGVISTTGTPTIAFRTAFGTALASITTSLATTATITTASGLANVDWYYYVIGGPRAAPAGSTTTMVASGYLIAQLATAAANNIINYVKNATPPSGVTTDISGAVYLDLQATWGTANAANTITTNHYRLASIYS